MEEVVGWNIDSTELFIVYSESEEDEDLDSEDECELIPGLRKKGLKYSKVDETSSEEDETESVEGFSVILQEEYDFLPE
jgi:hypothetical protein